MKKRNSIKSILLLTIISFVGVACVDEIKFGNAFLEKAPGEDVNEDVIFSKKVYTDYLLWQCYEGLFTPFCLPLTLTRAGWLPVRLTLHRGGWRI